MHFLLQALQLRLYSYSLSSLYITRRRLATVLQEIQQYQNTPYCIEPEPTMQKFLISQDPQGDATPLQWEENLFQQSHIIEPKDQPPIRAVCLRIYNADI